MPPIKKPQATAMFWMKISAMNSTTPTAAIVAYWRFRYACAPSWTAREMPCIRSLPGGSARQGTRGEQAVGHSACGANEGDDDPMVRQKAAQQKSSAV